MSARAVAHSAAASTSLPSDASARGLAVGFLSMLPLLAVYEMARAASGGPVRNVAELILFAPVDALWGEHAWVHALALCACTVVALWFAFRAHAGQADVGLVHNLWRIFLEGLVGAIVLGPLLVVALEVTGAGAPRAALEAQTPVAAPGVREAALIAGGAAYEELVFRVGCVSLCVLVFRRIARFLGAGEGALRVLPVMLAVAASAVVFAASHLALFTQALGPGGEAFDALVFTWRAAAGTFLAGVFCWRGPGVAAWTHALFNLALLVGAGPRVFL